jgi:Kef-type K+ transport system membrane component KefB
VPLVNASLYMGVVLSAAVLLGSVVSVELGLSVAIIEILLGIVIGNTMHPSVPD